MIPCPLLTSPTGEGPPPYCSLRTENDGAAEPAPGRRGERGYNLIVVIIAITIMNIMLAATLPLWSQAIRREKEEELIFRGVQYAEAIRVYRNRFQGALPTRLEDLIEKKPRSIRQLWKNPMREDGKWTLVFLNQPINPQNPGNDGDTGDGSGDGDDGRDSGGSSLSKSAFGTPAKGQTVAAGPITGVYSQTDKESILVFNGQQRYDKWVFTVDMLTLGGAPLNGQPGGIGNPNPNRGALLLDVRWLGRPLRQFGPQPGTLPDGTPTVPGAGLPGFNNPSGIGSPGGRPGGLGRPGATGQPGGRRPSPGGTGAPEVQ